MPGPFYQEGLYEVEIREVGFEEAKSGNPMIVFKILVDSSIDQNSANERYPCSHKYERFLRLVIVNGPDQKKNDDSRAYALMKLRNIGWDGDKFETLPDSLVGQVVVANCTHQKQIGGEYDGRVNEQWDFPLPPRESKPIENKPTLAKKLNALFGKSLKDSKPEKSHSPQAVASQVSGDSDEVPF